MLRLIVTSFAISLPGTMAFPQSTAGDCSPTIENSNEITLNCFSESEIAQAWSVVNTITTAESGRIDALNLLIRSSESLDSLDLSCRRMMGGWSPKYGNCARRVNLGRNTKSLDFRNSSFQNVDLSGTDLSYANFSEAWLWRYDFTGSFYSGTSFYETNVRNSTFDHADIQGTWFEGAEISDTTFKDADLFGSDFTDAKLYDVQFCGASMRQIGFTRATFNKVSFCTSDIYHLILTGAHFENTGDLELLELPEDWAWADKENPPTGLSGFEILLCPGESGFTFQKDCTLEILP